MPATVETFYDFRVRLGNLGFDADVEWVGRPIFIDVILNLQLDREPWAPFVDTLIPPMRGVVARMRASGFP